MPVYTVSDPRTLRRCAAPFSSMLVVCQATDRATVPVRREQLWPRDSLDAIIGRADLARIDDLLHAYFSRLRREALEIGHPADEAWRVAASSPSGPASARWRPVLAGGSRRPAGS